LRTAPPKTKLTVKLPELAGAAKDRIYLWRRRAATFATAILALVMAYGVIFGHNGLTAFAHKREEAKLLQEQMQQLQKENDRLHEHINHLQSDPDAIEHEAREELHYTRSGEVIYTLPNATSDPSKSSPSPNPAANNR
jgi:cell division protein FtsB